MNPNIITARTPFRSKDCQRKYCSNRATCTPIVRVPAMGMPIAEHAPLRIQPNNSFLCDAHYEAFSIGEMLTGKLQTAIRKMAKVSKRVEPDFKRAYKEKKLLSVFDS